MFWKRKAETFCQHSFAKKIELISCLPRILISRSAYNKMWHLVDIADKEVSWLGTCRRIEQDFLIEEVFLFKQEVAATTCEISADGLAEVANELLTSRPDGIEICNRLCFWGHSHVNMGTSPSGQDESQMENFSEYINIAGLVIAAASAVANLTPNNRDNAVVDILARVVDFFALNWRKRF